MRNRQAKATVARCRRGEGRIERILLTVQRLKKWLAKHPRFHLHFTPTSSSWLNLVERFFAKLTDKAIRRGIFHSVPDLTAAIEDYLKANNTNPTPFVWTATADQILAKVRRGRVTLNQTPPKTETLY